MLLHVLGEEASASALKSLDGDRAKRVQRLVTEFRTDPPSAAEIDYVVREFNTFFSFALERLEPEIRDAGIAAKKNAAAKETSRPVIADAGDDKVRNFVPLTATGDPVTDLNRLDPYQIATAIEGDHPKTIALIVRELSVPMAAAVLEQLGDDARTEAVVYLSQESTVPQLIVEQVLASTFDKANSVLAQKEESGKADELAELLRSLPKDMRGPLIERLTAEDPDLVESIRKKLYVFDDLLRLDDREIQKVLGEISTDFLIVGLQRADEELVSRILGNLSKRARQTIEEEMEYKANATDEEVEDARSKVVEVVQRFDENGDITLK